MAPAPTAVGGTNAKAEGSLRRLTGEQPQAGGAAVRRAALGRAALSAMTRWPAYSAAGPSMAAARPRIGLCWGLYWVLIVGGAPACALDFSEFKVTGEKSASIGADAKKDAQDSDGPTCGNGTLEGEERCDPGIEAGEAGACPESCDSPPPCTTSKLVGEASDCSAHCKDEAITEKHNGDECCPPGATLEEDDDCDPNCNNGDLDPGETCDDGEGSKTPCPASPEDCGKPSDDCHVFEVVGSNCLYICLEKEKPSASDDGCCPTGATSVKDSDCPPACNNGVLERTETCDPGSGTECPLPDSCVDTDDDPCTIEGFEGTADSCTARCVTTMTITEPDAENADGCCPAGVPAGMDADCVASCTNGVLESGELCDDGPTSTKPCGSGVCEPSHSCEVAEFIPGEGDDYCRVECMTRDIVECISGDECCPTGCTAAEDGDCSDACGNGVLDEDKGEKCDSAIAAGMPGACPTDADCAEASDPCKPIKVTGTADACTASCEEVPIVRCIPDQSDGCCSPERSCDANNDIDCEAVCGNGAREQGELCDGNCDDINCDDNNPCTMETLTGPDCRKYCQVTPITENINNDGCCLDGSSFEDDSDCPTRCGDGKVQGAEQCDPGKGSPTPCPKNTADCTEGDSCTKSITVVGEGCEAHCEYEVMPLCEASKVAASRSTE